MHLAIQYENLAMVPMVELTCINGFVAASKGKRIEDNPWHETEDRCEYEAWQHGWLCWTCSLPTLPWSIEKRISSPIVKKIVDRFRATRELPSQLLKELDYYK